MATEALNIDEAKTKLSQLVDKAAAGEDVVVSRNGKPLARIARLEPPRRRIRFGVLEGKIDADPGALVAAIDDSGFVELPVTACTRRAWRRCRRTTATRSTGCGRRRRCPGR